MINIDESLLQSTNGGTYPLRSIAWPGFPILDARAVRADYGHLLLLTTDGALHGINLDSGNTIELCIVDLPDFVPDDDDNSHFGGPSLRLHASADGAYAAIVVDQGQIGIVVEVLSGAITMQLDGGDYCQDTVPFSACFLSFKGRNVVVHRSAWNRLDAADAATGEPLTARFIAPHVTAGETPEHHLDYFHGQLLPSPTGSRIFDDGWVWHPSSFPRTWSVADWLGSYPWESEDGASIVYLPMRDEWTKPTCWIDDQHIALWGLDESLVAENPEARAVTEVRILDVTEAEPSPAGRWPMDLDEKSVLDLFSDGKRLYVVEGTGTTVWDIPSRSQITFLPGFTARLHDVARGTLVAFSPTAIVEFALPWRA